MTEDSKQVGKQGEKNSKKEVFGPGEDQQMLLICWSEYLQVFWRGGRQNVRSLGVHNIGGTCGFESNHVYYAFEILIIYSENKRLLKIVLESKLLQFSRFPQWTNSFC